MVDLTCKAAKYGIELDAQGNINPCCYAKPLVSLNDMTLDQVWNSKERLELLSNLENGIKDPHCSSCWEEESVGRQSKRMRENERLADFTGECETPFLVDIKPWNTCNLKCRICGPDNSSAWMNEYYEVEKEKFNGFDSKYYSDNNVVFWNTMESWLNNAKYIDFYGGEPVLIKKPWKLLEKNSSENNNKQLQFNTNATVPLSNVQLDTILKFEKVNIALSIDGIGEKFEYLRYPGKWTKTLENVDKYIEFSRKYDNINITFCHTVSIHNIWYVPEFDEFVKNRYGTDIGIWYNILFGPEHYRITNIPEHAKRLIEKKFISSSKDSLIHSILDFMNMKPCNEQRFSEFETNTLKYDMHRGQDFAEVFPEWRKVLYAQI